MKKSNPKPEPIAFGWRWHDGDIRRVWRNDWPGDMFELLSSNEWLVFLVWAQRFSFRVIEAEDNDD